MDEVGELLKMIASIDSGFLSTHLHMHPQMLVSNACRHRYIYTTHTITEMEKKQVEAHRGLHEKHLQALF